MNSDDQRREAERRAEEALAEEALARAPVPTLGLLGRTGAGKSSIVQALTGSDAAEIGDGYRPCTRIAQQYDWPDAAAPVLRFLDTRGLGEVDYDAAADLRDFASQTHLVGVVVRVADQAVGEVVEAMRAVRRAAPERPSLLVLTCLHELHPAPERLRWDGQPPQPVDAATDDADATDGDHPAEAATLGRAVDKQYERFAGLFDAAVAIDLTPVEWAMPQPDLGLATLRAAILELLPAAQSQAARVALAEAADPSTGAEHARFVGYATAAATAAAVPVPWIDVPVVAGLQWRLTAEMARRHGQAFDRTATARLSGLIGTRAVVGMGLRGLLKGLPVLGSALNAAAAFASTYAAGAAADFYFAALAADPSSAPDAAELKRVYQDQLQRAMQMWKA